MERVKCRVCAAMVAMPLLEVEGGALPRWKCGWCEHLLARDAYCDREERLVRMCLACREGPERQRPWHKVELTPRWSPDLDRQRNDRRQEEIHRAVNPALQAPPPPEESLEAPKKRKRGTRWRRRRRTGNSRKKSLNQK
ncbi:hypothetical protein PC129_g19984 [Phytophthora cactorum]|uniref:Uncharacterized protein n=1 Tax=Phytophthora cactorum TaxID=29920 RepID=A0A329S1T0_9STRA|nr:hypothetical protein Pcac1_g9258 [Phytophthora cactorum]KAG2799562.1 hypothetical protein PC112_g20848 [Phytophthora cactorum]KAG2799971.1 hypothetical protein PC111_g20177 [Phytophthora cactorum]KAG2832209.1 hypothetical protein PC113_g20788 [Phytophthora cactorum]KAG2878504.1 hypothetical protein PC114_g23082 [Phytophthora cactorum]